MVKKEVSEMRRMFRSIEDTSVRKIATCYVDVKGNAILKSKENFLSLPEEEAFKYLDLMSKGLSGSFGKSLYNLDCATADKCDGKENWEFTERLRQSELENDALLDQFYEKIIENCQRKMESNYLIIVAHGYYDIPGVGNKMDTDAYEGSEDVYEYLMCLLCPVALSQPGLAVNCSKGKVEDRVRDWIVNKPTDALLYPAFHGRQEDLHHALYYSKGSMLSEFTNQLIGNDGGLSGKEEKEWFVRAMEEMSETGIPLENAKKLQQKVMDLEAAELDNEQLEVGKTETDALLRQSGFPEKERELFKECFESLGEEKKISLKNIIDTKHVTLEGDGFTLKVDADLLDEIKTKMMDGRLHLTIPLTNSSLLLNGIPAKTATLKS